MTQSLFNCCKYCTEPKRHPGCHSTCEEYLEDRRIKDEINRQKVVEYQVEEYHKLRNTKIKDKIAKKKKRHGKQ